MAGENPQAGPDIADQFGKLTIGSDKGQDGVAQQARAVEARPGVGGDTARARVVDAIMKGFCNSLESHITKIAAPRKPDQGEKEIKVDKIQWQSADRKASPPEADEASQPPKPLISLSGAPRIGMASTAVRAAPKPPAVPPRFGDVQLSRTPPTLAARLPSPQPTALSSQRFAPTPPQESDEQPGEKGQRETGTPAAPPVSQDPPQAKPAAMKKSALFKRSMESLSSAFFRQSPSAAPRTRSGAGLPQGIQPRPVPPASGAPGAPLGESIRRIWNVGYRRGDPSEPGAEAPASERSRERSGPEQYLPTSRGPPPLSPAYEEVSAIDDYGPEPMFGRPAPPPPPPPPPAPRHEAFVPRPSQPASAPPPTQWPAPSATYGAAPFAPGPPHPYGPDTLPSEDDLLASFRSQGHQPTPEAFESFLTSRGPPGGGGAFGYGSPFITMAGPMHEQESSRSLGATGASSGPYSWQPPTTPMYHHVPPPPIANLTPEASPATQSSATPASKSARRRPSSQHGPGLKEDDEEEASDHDGRRKKAKKAAGGAAAGDRKFACPYFKRNRNKYRKWTSCPGPGWEEVHRVKTHLYRRHALPLQCPRCWDVFKVDEQFRAHLQCDPPCEFRDNRTPLEGFTKDQEKRLRSRKKAQPDMTDEDKWREIYMILFPDDDRNAIPSPFYDDSDVEDDNSGGGRSGSNSGGGDLEDYATFLRREMPTLVRRELEVLFETEYQDIEDKIRDRVADIVVKMQPKLLALYQQSQLPLSEYGPPQQEQQQNLQPDYSGGLTASGSVSGSASNSGLTPSLSTGHGAGLDPITPLVSPEFGDLGDDFGLGDNLGDGLGLTGSQFQWNTPQQAQTAWADAILDLDWQTNFDQILDGSNVIEQPQLPYQAQPPGMLPPYYR